MTTLSPTQKEMIQDFIIKPGSDRSRPTPEQIKTMINDFQDKELLSQARNHVIEVGKNTLSSFYLWNVPKIGLLIMIYILTPFASAYAGYQFIKLLTQIITEETGQSSKAEFIVALLCYLLASRVIYDKLSTGEPLVAVGINSRIKFLNETISERLNVLSEENVNTFSLSVNVT
jgi:hypothetical protein